MCVLTFEMTVSVFELLMDPRFKRSVSGNPSLESFIIAFDENPFTKIKFPEASQEVQHRGLKYLNL